MGFIPFSQRKAEVHYRKVVRPVPEVLPACKNCKSFRYDSDDRQNFKGEVTFRRVNLRCSQFGFGASLESVCDKHDFRHADRRDA